MATCPTCGHENDDDAKFCSECGARRAEENFRAGGGLPLVGEMWPQPMRSSAREPATSWLLPGNDQPAALVQIDAFGEEVGQKMVRAVEEFAKSAWVDVKDLDEEPPLPPVGVKNSDHPCDLRLRRIWPPVRSARIAFPEARVRTPPPTELAEI